MENLIFSELSLSKEVQKAISEMGFEEATPIQSLAIPHVMEGKDVIGQAQTGTGKTCAFGIPAIEMIDPSSEGIQVLVLCPTRELAIQTAEEIKNVSKHKRGIKILPVYGGQPIDRQIMALKKKPQIVIGTPGRIMDHMRRHTIKFTNLKILVLDEADEMLNMGFREDIDTILEKAPEERQTVLFSATMSRDILEITKKYQKNPIHVKAAHKELTVPSIEQFYIEVKESFKLELISRLIDTSNIKLSMVFCNTKKRVDELAASLQSRGYQVEALHGDMKQAQRDKVMAKFRKGHIDVLIATDVAARGIDVDDVEAVFNYDIPNNEEYYVHRIGRTGRAGRAGRAYTFVSGREIYKLKDIQRYTKSTILPLKPPSLSDVEETKVNSIMDKLKKTLESGHLSKYVSYIEKMMEDSTGDSDSEEYTTTLDIAAAFLKMAVMGDKAQSDEKSAKDPLESTNETGTVRLFMNVGSMDKLQKRNIIDALTSCSSLLSGEVGRVDILERFSFVDVPAEKADDIIAGMKRTKLNGRKVNIERANSKK